MRITYRGHEIDRTPGSGYFRAWNGGAEPFGTAYLFADSIGGIKAMIDTKIDGDEPCDCSENDGPCEAHMETVVMREGASSRSADELIHVFLTDAVELGAEPSEYGKALLKELDDEASWEGSWLRDPDLADAMRDLAWQFESDIATLDAGPYYTRWDDGFVVYKITGGPLAPDDDSDD